MDGRDSRENQGDSNGVSRCVAHRELACACLFRCGQSRCGWEFREVVTAQFGDRVEMGRFHEREVGPHPRWSYQIAFAPTQFSDVVGWLALNHGALDVLRI